MKSYATAWQESSASGLAGGCGGQWLLLLLVFGAGRQLLKSCSGHLQSLKLKLAAVLASSAAMRPVVDVCRDEERGGGGRYLRVAALEVEICLAAG